jgi:UDP-N-acetylglucosamine 1-carboxyvinyltransferase
MTAAVLAEGETLISNAAREPEVVEISQALREMGAQIEGDGTPEIRIQGVSSLGGLDWEVQADRIQLITYLTAAAITGGEIEVYPYRSGTMDRVLEKLRDMGCEIQESPGKLSLKSHLPFKPVSIETAPFPGFPTDAQAQFVACLCLADPEGGLSRVRETVFENRFQHVSELRRMGASIRLRGNLATIRGVPKLSGAAVMASDLRASASLVLAGLAAEGKTQVLRVYHLDRGYQNLEENLNRLGARVWRAPQ